MNKLFGKKSIIDRAKAAVGLKSKRSSSARTSGLITAGGVAGLAIVSAVISALRDRQDNGGSDAR